MNSTAIFVAIVVIVYFWYRQKFLKRNELADKLPGPRGFPIVGNALLFVAKSPPQMLKVLEKIYNDYSHHKIARIRIVNDILVLITHPTTAEVILSSQKFIEKSDEYVFISEWLSTGLLTSTGAKWFARRKVITPTFHFKILEQFVEVFDKNSKILVKQLSQLKGRSTDIFPLVTLCALDVICGEENFLFPITKKKVRID
jgi:cytochrome P450 family 4